MRTDLTGKAILEKFEFQPVKPTGLTEDELSKIINEKNRIMEDFLRDASQISEFSRGVIIRPNGTNVSIFNKKGKRIKFEEDHRGFKRAIVRPGFICVIKGHQFLLNKKQN